MGSGQRRPGVVRVTLEQPPMAMLYIPNGSVGAGEFLLAVLRVRLSLSPLDIVDLYKQVPRIGSLIFLLTQCRVPI
jgi:hypothetical protein